MIKLITLIIVCLFLLFTSCAKYETEKINDENFTSYENTVHKKQEDDIYQKFLTKFMKENLNNKGINIDKIIKEHFSDENDIIEIDYQMHYVNLSKDKEQNSDIVIVIHIKNQFFEVSDIVCIFVSLSNGQFINVLNEMHKYVEISFVDILNNGKKQILLITDDSGNGHTLQPIKILSFKNISQSMEIIFDEVLRGYSFLPYKEKNNSEFYNISFENEYEFITTKKGDKEILFKSKIFEKEDIILESGSTRFIFNGEKFVPIDYYDYRALAKQIYDKRTQGDGSPVLE